MIVLFFPTGLLYEATSFYPASFYLGGTSLVLSSFVLIPAAKRLACCGQKFEDPNTVWTSEKEMEIKAQLGEYSSV